MTAAKKLLIGGGLLLAVWGMVYGFYYAVFVEHQTLDSIGGALAGGFTFAAQRNLPACTAALQQFTAASYVYLRQVDAHGHWIGLSMLLMLFGIVFHRVSFGRRGQILIASALVFGAVTFPLGVLLETVSAGAIPKFIAAAGSAVMIAALAATALGFTLGNSADID